MTDVKNVILAEILPYIQKGDDDESMDVKLINGFRFNMERLDPIFSNVGMIVIKIFNEVNIQIYELRLSTHDICRTIDNITQFLYCFDKETDSAITIELFNYQAGDIIPLIEFYRLNLTIDDVPNNKHYIDQSMDELRSIRMRIYNYDKRTNSSVTIMETIFSDTELDQFCYELFFVGLMGYDRSLTDEENEMVNASLGRMYHEMTGYDENADYWKYYE